MTETEADALDAALAGNEAAFGRLTARYRRELHVHCYRMLASFDDAEDRWQSGTLHIATWRRVDSRPPQR